MADNAIIRKDGATVGHLQESSATIDDNGSVNIPSGQTYDINGTPHTHDAADITSNEFSIQFVIGNGTDAITTSDAVIAQEVPTDCTVTGWTIVSDASGSIVIDIWADSYANFPPTIADTIAGSEKPTLSSAQKNQDLTLSTWTTSLTKGDWVLPKIDSTATVKWVVLSIRCTVA